MGGKGIDLKINFSTLAELKSDAQATVTGKVNQKQINLIEQLRTDITTTSENRQGRGIGLDIRANQLHYGNQQQQETQENARTDKKDNRERSGEK